MSDEIKNLYTDVDVSEDISDENIESVEPQSTALTPVVKKVKKHAEAKKLVEEAKSLVDANVNELNECRVLLENDLRDYEDAKRALRLGGLDDSKALLVELGHTSPSELDTEEESIAFVPSADIEPIVIKDIYSGKFSAFIFSLLAGLAAFVGLVYLATEKIGLTLDISKIPQKSTIDDILNWFSSLVGIDKNPEIGMAMLAIAVFLVISLVYAVRVGFKGGSNLRFANHQMKETQKYVTHRANCKIEMDRVDAHINDAIKTLGDYQVLLNEQHGKLVRILHFEGIQTKEFGYTHTSKEEMRETQNIITIIQDFIVQSMSTEGRLAEESSQALTIAKDKVTSILKTLSQSVG